MLRGEQIPRLAERLIVAEMTQMSDRISKAAGYVDRPREWAIYKIVWVNHLHNKLTSACEVARATRLPRTTAMDYLHKMVGKKRLQVEDQRYCIPDELIRRPAFSENGQPALLDQYIAAIHAASDALRALERQRRQQQAAE